MELAGSIYSAIQRARSLKGEDIHRLTDGERDTLGWLRSEGYWE